MARESKLESDIRQSITRYLTPGEMLHEFSWGTTEGSISAAAFWFGSLGAALAGQNDPSFLVGLTNRRLLLIEVKGRTPTGQVHSISTSDIKGLKYRSSGTTGNLNVHLSADILCLIFAKRPWWGRAKKMAKMMPLPA